jgi:hypothetical protein
MEAPEAIRIAMDKVDELFGGEDHRLEEIELMDDGGFTVTISYHAPDAPPASVPVASGSLLPKLAFGFDTTRYYKQVSIRPDGKVNAVRMRQILVG